MDKETVIKWFEKYPKLENFIGSGTISLKLARDILDVDRLFMQDMYTELLLAGAVKANGNSCFRATKELQEFLKERRV